MFPKFRADENQLVARKALPPQQQISDTALGSPARAPPSAASRHFPAPATKSPRPPTRPPDPTPARRRAPRVTPRVSAPERSPLQSTRHPQWRHQNSSSQQFNAGAQPLLGTPLD